MMSPWKMNSTRMRLRMARVKRVPVLLKLEKNLNLPVRTKANIPVVKMMILSGMTVAARNKMMKRNPGLARSSFQAKLSGIKHKIACRVTVPSWTLKGTLSAYT